VSHFGYRSDPFHGGGQFHPGVDLSARIGTPIKATGDGRVVAAGPFHGYGIHVEIDHGFGYRTIYAHLSKTKVRVGEKVKRGTVVGLSGNTGYSTGPHLHYEVIKNGQKSNPLDYIYVE
jgi:murein DD-endopeptidase MepM/ murein hydrolase activator NlpD